MDGLEIPTNLIPSNDERVEYVDDVGGLYFRAILLHRAGDVVPQHTHDYEHVTLCCSGSARVWIDGVYSKDIKAFEAMLIEADKKHVFQALEANTRLACVHQLNGKPYGG